MENIDFNQIEKWIDSYNKNSDKAVKKQMLNLIVITCSPFVKNIAYGLARRASDPVEDIIQVANLGLIKAVIKYNASYKNLKTWLTYSIIGEIKHYLRDKANLVKPPREIIELAYRINKLSPENIETDGSIYSQYLIAQKFNVSEEKIREVFETERRKVISLDELVFDDNAGTSYIDNITIPEEELDYKDEYGTILNDAINKLTDKQKKIIIGIYFEGKLQSDLAKELNTYQSNISRMQKNALSKLFNIINNKEG